MASRRHYVEVRVLYGKDIAAELNAWAAKGYKVVVATGDRIIMETKVRDREDEEG